MPQSIKFDLKTIAIGSAIVLVLWLGYVIFYPIKFVTDTNVTIPEGSTVKSIARLLSENKLIRSEHVFIVYVSALGEDRNLKAGDYIIPRITNMDKIVGILSGGLSESDDIQITLPEGLNIWEIDKKLTDLGYIFEGELSSKYYADEGYLFPDTYRLKSQNLKSLAGDIGSPLRESKVNLRPELRSRESQTENSKINIEELRDKMKNNFSAKTKELLKSDFDSREIVIIASILEKEAKKEEDMKLVAGIIAKRISIDMPLEVDASVVYGTCRRLLGLDPNNQNPESQIPNPEQIPNQNDQNSKLRNCDVTFQGPAVEIKIDSPYNTYIRKGLPIGPISNPGLMAIRATLDSRSSDYLYYLSTRDGSEIIYSKTPAEHNQNRKKYLGI